MKMVTAAMLCLVPGAALAAPALLDPTLSVDTVITGLSQPTTMAFLGPADFLVLEKATGLVRRVKGSTIQTPALLDFNVNSNSERGLLGIAISKASPPDVFLYLTERDGPGDSTAQFDSVTIANRVYRYTWNAGPGTLTGATLILDLPAAGGPNHDGGVLELDNASPQRLYAMIGDLNRAGQLQNQATGNPDDTSVILRVDRNGNAAAGNPLSPYCSNDFTQTCSANPDCGAGTCFTQVGRYYAYGIRNGFGLTVDPVTGAVWNTENGPTTYDEINRVEPGFNSGWLDYMGAQSTGVRGGQDGALFEIDGGEYSDPEFSWIDTNAPTGIVFPSTALGTAYGSVALVGDSNRSQIYRFPLNAGRTGFDFTAFASLQDLEADTNTEADQLLLGTGFGNVTDLEIGPDGNVYVVGLGAGAVYRIQHPTDYFTVAPCRVVDTRNPDGPLGGPALANGGERSFDLTGLCGVPEGARAIAINVTAIQPTAGGLLSVSPGDLTFPQTSSVNFNAGQTRANNAQLPLSSNGDGTLRVLASMPGGGSVHVVIDVNGYFQ